jgi:two-component system, OmpR family, response regulator ArlR
MSANPTNKQRILLVDDEERIVNFLSLKLRVSGYDVVCANDGEKGLELATSANPDLMLLDIIMPGIDGIEVLKRLRKFSDVPVIVLSAKERVMDEVMTLGANGFISKPFNPDDLIIRIRHVLPAAKP